MRLCEWCRGQATGTAIWQGDGMPHLSCGSPSHGFDFRLVSGF